MKKVLTIIGTGLLFMAASCTKTQDAQPASDQSSSNVSERLLNDPGTISSAANSSIGVYFNNQLYKVELGPSTHDVIPGTTSFATVNSLYVIRPVILPGVTTHFLTPVVDALPRTSFSSSTLWQEVIITFTEPSTKSYQLYSADEISKLVNAPNSMVTATRVNVFFELQLSKDQRMAMQ